MGPLPTRRNRLWGIRHGVVTPLFCAFLTENQGEILFFEFYALFLQSQMGADQPLSLGMRSSTDRFGSGDYRARKTSVW